MLLFEPKSLTVFRKDEIFRCQLVRYVELRRYGKKILSARNEPRWMNELKYNIRANISHELLADDTEAILNF